MWLSGRFCWAVAVKHNQKIRNTTPILSFAILYYFFKNRKDGIYLTDLLYQWTVLFVKTRWKRSNSNKRIWQKLVKNQNIP